MESELDRIEDESLDWKELMRSFYAQFSKDLDTAKKDAKKVEIKLELTGDKCPDCGKDLVYRNGRNGK